METRKKYLRKLDGKETNLIKRGFDQDVILRTKFKSQIELFDAENLEIFKNSILIWKSWQKLLSSRIQPLNESEFYFEHVDDNDHSYRFENVKFIRLHQDRTPTSNEFKEIADLIFENCHLNEINPEKQPNQLLWSIILFEMDRVGDSMWTYEIFLTMHHTIAQGFSTFLCLCELLRIFDKLKKKQKVELSDQMVFPGCEEIFSFALDYSKPRPMIKRPSFINPIRAKSDSLNRSYPTNFGPNSRLVDIESGKTFETLGELVEKSRKSHMKLKSYRIDQHRYQRLLNKCHQEGATLTGFFQVLLSVCVNEMYRTYGTPDEVDKIRVVTVLNLRPFAKEAKIDDFTLGLCTGNLVTDISAQEIPADRHRLGEKFWPLAAFYSKQLHERYNSDLDKFFPKYETGEASDMRFHFSVSNTGGVNASDIIIFDNFKFENAFASSNFEPNCDKRLFASFIFKYQQDLSCSLLYNSHFIDSFLIDFLLNNLSSFLDDILNSDSAHIKSNL